MQMTIKNNVFRIISVDLFVVYTFFSDIIEQILGLKFSLVWIIPSIAFAFIPLVFGDAKYIIKEKVFFLASGWLYFAVVYVACYDVMIANGNIFKPLRWIWAVFIMLSFVSMKEGHGHILITAAVCSFVNAAATILFFIVPSLYKFMHTIYHEWPAGTDNGKFGFKAALTNHYSHNAMLIIPVILILTSYLLTSKKKGHKKFAIIALVISAFAIILTAKRAHLLFGVAAVVVTYLIIGKGNKFKRVFLLGIIAVLAVALFYIASLYVPQINLVLQRFETVGEDNSSTTRLKMWALAFTLFRNHPIFGAGWGAYKFLYSETFHKDPLDAHNVYIQMLAETGVIGFIIFVFTAFSALYVTIRYIKKRKTLNMPIVYSLVMQMFVLMYCTTGNCIYDIMFCHYIIALGIAYSTLSNQKGSLYENWHSYISQSL